MPTSWRDEGLRREIGVLRLAANIVNIMVGAGILRDKTLALSGVLSASGGAWREVDR